MSGPVAPKQSGESGQGRAWLGYTALRLGLFALCLLLGWVAGLSGFPLLLAALLVSGALAWFLLARQRMALGTSVERWVNRLGARSRTRTAVEDAYVDGLEQSRERDDANPRA